MEQAIERKVDSTKILMTLVFLLTLFSVMPAFALFFDFDDNEKLEGWKEEGGKWKVENGVYIGEELNAIEGVTLIGEEDWTDLTFEGYYNDKLVTTMEHKDHEQGRIGLLVWEGSSGFDDVSIMGPGIPGLAVNPKGS